MPTAKDIRIAPISVTDARRIIQKLHYSHKVDPRSQLHLGAFLNGRLHGALQFGPSLDKRKIQKLVRDTGWNEFIELNRLAFSDNLPRNSESRALSIAARLIRKHYPHIKWIISFADATQCGDGTIYRAAGFLLTQITKNKGLYRLPDGTVHKSIVFDPAFGSSINQGVKQRYGKTGSESSGQFLKRIGAYPIPGYMFRYIYPIDPTVIDRLTVPIIPYADIPKECKMCLGKRASEAGDDRQPDGTAAVQH